MKEDYYGRGHGWSGPTFKELQRIRARARAAWLESLRRGSPGRRHGGAR